MRISIINLVCFFLSFASTAFAQSEFDNLEREAMKEGIFRKYLMTEDESYAKILANSEDENIYSLFCKAVFAETEEAIKLYTKFIEKKPKYGLGEAYFNRGVKYFLSEHLEFAISDFDKAISLGIKDPYLYYFKGAALADTEKYDDAIKNYSTSIKISNNFALAYFMRGNSYYSKKDYSKALSDYNKVIELDKKEDMAYLMRGLVYEALGDYKKALNDWQKVKNMKGENAENANNQIERLNKKIKEGK